MAERRQSRLRISRAQSLVEAMVGFIVIIPIALIAVDVVALLTTTQANEQWAETAARAAGSCSCETRAKIAVENSLRRFVSTNIMNSVDLEKITFDEANGQVTVATVMQVNMPVPLPFMNHFECHASAIQPLLATPAAQ